MTARIPPADLGDPALAEVVALIARERGQLGELYPMLLHSPAIARGMVELGNGVRKEASLPARTRELAICRVGALNGAAYEVARHREIAQTLGVGVAVLDALENPASLEDSPLLSRAERDTLAYVDVMTTTVRVPDEIYRAMAGHWTHVEILELTTTIAYYNMISRVLVALRIGDRAPDEENP